MEILTVYADTVNIFVSGKKKKLFWVLLHFFVCFLFIDIKNSSFPISINVCLLYFFLAKHWFLRDQCKLSQVTLIQRSEVLLLHFELTTTNINPVTHLSYRNTLDDDNNDDGSRSEPREWSILIVKTWLKISVKYKYIYKKRQSQIWSVS